MESSPNEDLSLFGDPCRTNYALLVDYGVTVLKWRSEPNFHLSSQYAHPTTKTDIYKLVQTTKGMSGMAAHEA